MPRPSEVDDAAAAVILETLERHHVNYVLIGGKAAQSHGWTGETRDLDITPQTTDDNLDRLARALDELEAG